jgi:hypothetical protein
LGDIWSISSSKVGGTTYELLSRIFKKTCQFVFRTLGWTSFWATHGIGSREWSRGIYTMNSLMVTFPKVLLDWSSGNRRWNVFGFAAGARRKSERSQWKSLLILWGMLGYVRTNPGSIDLWSAMLTQLLFAQSAFSSKTAIASLSTI